MKKTLNILVVGALVGTMLVGCSQGTEGNGNGPDGAAPSTKSATPADANAPATTPEANAPATTPEANAPAAAGADANKPADAGAATNEPAKK